jgi:hypothetical protein
MSQTKYDISDAVSQSNKLGNNMKYDNPASLQVVVQSGKHKFLLVAVVLPLNPAVELKEQRVSHHVIILASNGRKIGSVNSRGTTTRSS